MARQLTIPSMDVRVHGAIPTGAEDILTPEVLR